MQQNYATHARSVPCGHCATYARTVPVDIAQQHVDIMQQHVDIVQQHVARMLHLGVGGNCGTILAGGGAPPNNMKTTLELYIYKLNSPTLGGRECYLVGIVPLTFASFCVIMAREWV